MAIQESGEMYLETILVLSRKLNRVRAIDVGEELGYSKPSVSRAMSILKNDGYITVNEDGGILLTKSGKEIAEKIYERHIVLSSLLTSIGVPEEIAIEDACRMEHVISDESFDIIKKLHEKRNKNA